MVIYKITNLVNNKIYIGKTCKSIEERWKRHLTDTYLGKNPKIALRKAILKYGKENFKIEKIDDAISKDELNEKEIYWINYYNSTNREIGYNLTKGGDGNDTYALKDEDELKLIKEKISKTKIGGKNPKARRIKCLNIESNEELFFESLSLCQAFFGEENHNFITRRCIGKTKFLYKGIWNFAYQDSSYHEATKTKNIKRKKPIEVKINNEWVYFSSLSDFVKTQKEFSLKQFSKRLQKTTDEIKNVFGYEIKEINKCVSTMADECKPVGLEISTNSEREATLKINNVEDIVSANSDVGKKCVEVS